MVWLGSGILGIRKKPIPDPGSGPGVKKAPDPDPQDWYAALRCAPSFFNYMRHCAAHVFFKLYMRHCGARLPVLISCCRRRKVSVASGHCCGVGVISEGSEFEIFSFCFGSSFPLFSNKKLQSFSEIWMGCFNELLWQTPFLFCH